MQYSQSNLTEDSQPFQYLFSRMREIPYWYIYIFYLLCSGFIYFHTKTLVFDEHWFLSSNYKFINHLAYGDLYWVFVTQFNSELFLRSMAFLSMLSIPVIIYKFGQIFNVEKYIRHLAILLWLSFPASWWYGKLIGPELYCLSLGFLGLYLALKENILGYLLMGLAVGIKLSFITFPFFYFLFVFLCALETNKSFYTTTLDFLKSKKFLLFVLLIFAGFLIGSPSILWDPKRYINNTISFSSSHFRWDFDTILSQKLALTWDGILLPSLTQFSLHMLPGFVLFCFVYLSKIKYDKPFFLSLLFSFILTFILCSKVEGYLSWYWYPFIILLPLIFYKVQPSKKIFSLVIILNFILNTPISFMQLYIKYLNIRSTYNYKPILSFLNKKRYAWNNRIMSLEPNFKGKSLFSINKHLDYSIPFKQPTLIILGKAMMIPTAARSNNIYQLIYDVVLTDNVVNAYSNKIQAWAKKTASHYNYLGEYKGAYIFLVEPPRVK